MAVLAEWVLDRGTVITFWSCFFQRNIFKVGGKGSSRPRLKKMAGTEICLRPELPGQEF